MFIIKRLILSNWFKFTFFSGIILFLITSAANLIAGFLRGNVTGYEVFLNYLLEIPTFLLQILPVSCLIGSLFAFNKLISRNELTAILASGYPRKKIISDVFQAAIVISLIQFFLTSYADPYIRSKRFKIIGDSAIKFRNLKKEGLRQTSISDGKFWFKGTDYFISFSVFDKSQNSMKNISYFLYDENHQLKQKIEAKEAVFISANSWEFKNGNSLTNLSTKEKYPEIIPFKNLTLNLNETPEDLKRIESDITTLNIKGLYKYISTLKESGLSTSEYEIMFLQKFSTSIICIIFALLGSISVFKPNRRSATFGKTIVFIMVFVILYYFISSYFVELGNGDKLAPFLSSFTIPSFFLLVLLFIFYRNRKLV